MHTLSKSSLSFRGTVRKPPEMPKHPDEEEVDQLKVKWDLLNHRIELLEKDVGTILSSSVIDIKPLLSMAEHLNQFYKQNEKAGEYGKHYLNTVLEIEAALQEYSMKHQEMETDLKEATEKNTIFKLKIDEREVAKQEYYKNRIKYDEKPKDPKKLAKLEQRYEESKRFFEKLNSELRKEMSDAYSDRHQFLDTKYRALISKQAVLFTAISSAYQGLVIVINDLATQEEMNKARTKSMSIITSNANENGIENDQGQTRNINYDSIVRRKKLRENAKRKIFIPINENGVDFGEFQDKTEQQADTEESKPDSPSTPSNGIDSPQPTPRGQPEEQSSEDDQETRSRFDDSESFESPSTRRKRTTVRSDIFPLFGKTLKEAAGNNKVPIIVHEIIKFLSQPRNLSEEGIGRQSGAASQIQKLKKKFDSGKRVNLKKYDVHAIMGVLKVFFRELTTPLIPESMNKQATGLFAQQKDPEITANISPEILFETIKSELRDLLLTLPTVHFEVLKELTGFFIMIASQSDKNKMTLNNILTCFTPTLLCSPGIFKFCIEDYSFFFSSPPPTAP